MIQVRRKSSGEITAIRFKRERPDIANYDEFHAEVVPTIRADRHGGKFLYKPLTFDDMGGWCTVRPA